jgi:hypothetical protein
MNEVQIAPIVAFLPRADPAVPDQVSLAPTLLLPQPQPVNDEDALSGLLILQSRSRTIAMDRTVANINSLRQEQQEEWERQKAALFQAAQAQEESSFWGSIGEVCGVVAKVAAVAASAALAVSTAGAGTPFVLAVAGACLSGAAMAQGEFHVLEKLGVDSVDAGWIEIGLCLTGASCSFGAAWQGAASLNGLQDMATTAGRIASGVSGASTLAQAGATKAKSDADSEMEERYADAESAQLEESRLQQLFARILDDLQASEDSYRKTVTAINGATETRDSTLLIATRSN